MVSAALPRLLAVLEEAQRERVLPRWFSAQARQEERLPPQTVLSTHTTQSLPSVRLEALQSLVELMTHQRLALLEQQTQALLRGVAVAALAVRAIARLPGTSPPPQLHGPAETAPCGAAAAALVRHLLAQHSSLGAPQPLVMGVPQPQTVALVAALVAHWR